MEDSNNNEVHDQYIKHLQYMHDSDLWKSSIEIREKKCPFPIILNKPNWILPNQVIYLTSLQTHLDPIASFGKMNITSSKFAVHNCIQNRNVYIDETLLTPSASSPSTTISSSSTTSSMAHASSIPPSYRERIINEKTLTIDDFQIGKNIGSGSYGLVYLARRRNTGFICAIKVVSLDYTISIKSQHQLQREIDILVSQQGQKDVIQFYQYFSDKRFMYLVFEYCPYGDLYECTMARYPLNINKLQKWIKQLATCLKRLHSQGIMHRDIKLENIFVNRNGDVILADFGWAVKLNRFKKLTQICGTLGYMAPELMQGYYDFRADIWPLGALLYELISGHLPFDTLSSFQVKLIIMEKIKEGIQTWSKNFDMFPHSKDLILKLVEINPDKRITLDEVLEHPFITSAVLDPLSASSSSSQILSSPL